MKKLIACALAACFLAALFSCGGGGSEGDPNIAGKPFGRRSSPTFTGSAVTGLIGIVVDCDHRHSDPGATVAAGGLTTTSDATGNFAMPTIANGTSVVSFNVASYAPQSRTVVITSGIETSVIMLDDTERRPRHRPSSDPTALHYDKRGYRAHRSVRRQRTH